MKDVENEDVLYQYDGAADVTDVSTFFCRMALPGTGLSFSTGGLYLNGEILRKNLV